MVHKHGGVLIATKDGIYTKKIENIAHICEEFTAEFAAIDIPKSNISVMGIYRSLNGHLGTFISKLYEALEILVQHNTSRKLIVAGDFNINFLKDSKGKSILLETFETFGMRPVMTEASRITDTSNTCIDNIFINLVHVQNNLFKYTKSWHISDHKCQILKFVNHSHEAEIKQKISYREINDQTTYRFKQYIAAYDWTHLENECAKEAYTIFQEMLTNAFDMHFPVKEKQIKENTSTNIKWMTDKLEKMKSTLVEKDPKIFEILKVHKRTYLQEIESTHKNHNAHIIGKADNKQKAI